MEYQRQSSADQALMEHMNTIGALPVVAGTVKETMPGQGFNPDMIVARPADKSRTVTHKSAEGDKVQWELPTPETQQAKQLKLAAPVIAAGQANTQATAQATALGTAQGRTAGETQDLAANGVALDEPTAARLGVPASTQNPDGTTTPLKWTRQQIEALSQRITPAAIRGEASRDTANIRANSAEDVANTKAATTTQLTQENNDARDARANTRLSHEDAWAKARNAVAGNTQNSLNARQNMKSFDTAQTNWGKAQDQADAESQKIMDAQALVNPAAVADNDTFTHPWTKTKQTMNPAWRTQLAGAIQGGQSRVQRLQGQADAIRQQYGVTPPAPGAGGQPAPAGGGQARPAAATPAKLPSGTVRMKDEKGVTYTGTPAQFKAAQAAGAKLQMVQ
jgi:hypothetical protein